MNKYRQRSPWRGVIALAAGFGIVGALVALGLAVAANMTMPITVLCGAGAGILCAALGLAIGWFGFAHAAIKRDRMSRAEISTESAAQPEPLPTEVWQPRFRINTIFLLTFVTAIAAAAGYYMVRALKATQSTTSYDVDRQDVFMFLMFTFTAPVIIMVVLSFIWGLFPAKRRKK